MKNFEEFWRISDKNIFEVYCFLPQGKQRMRYSMKDFVYIPRLPFEN